MSEKKPATFSDLRTPLHVRRHAENAYIHTHFDKLAVLEGGLVLRRREKAEASCG